VVFGGGGKQVLSVAVDVSRAESPSERALFAANGAPTRRLDDPVAQSPGLPNQQSQSQQNQSQAQASPTQALQSQTQSQLPPRSV